MRREIVFGLVVALWAAPVLCNAQEIARVSLDEAGSLALTIAADSKIKVEGQGAVRITTQWPTVVPLKEIPLAQAENVKLLYTAQLKAVGLEGTAFLEMWCFVDGGQYFSRGLDSVVTGTGDWQKVGTPFFLKPGQKADKVILNLVINGTGTVWIDDVVLAKEPLS